MDFVFSDDESVIECSCQGNNIETIFQSDNSH